MIISNTSYNKRTSLNALRPINDDRFDLWKTRFKIFIESINLELWEIIINDLFTLTRYINSEVVYKHVFLWTEVDKRKFKFDFKAKNFLTISLGENQFLYTLNCNPSKKVWDIIEMIYGVSPSINQKRMNTWVQVVEIPYEYECYFHRRCSIIGNLGKHVRTFVTNKYLRIMISNRKFDPILKSRDESIYDF